MPLGIRRGTRQIDPLHAAGLRSTGKILVQLRSHMLIVPVAPLLLCTICSARVVRKGEDEKEW